VAFVLRIRLVEVQEVNITTASDRQTPLKIILDVLIFRIPSI
jgi:hypothetical protein